MKLDDLSVHSAIKMLSVPICYTVAKKIFVKSAQPAIVPIIGAVPEKQFVIFFLDTAASLSFSIYFGDYIKTSSIAFTKHVEEKLLHLKKDDLIKDDFVITQQDSHAASTVKLEEPDYQFDVHSYLTRANLPMLVLDVIDSKVAKVIVIAGAKYYFAHNIPDVYPFTIAVSNFNIKIMAETLIFATTKIIDAAQYAILDDHQKLSEQFCEWLQPMDICISVADISYANEL